jgi:hypothetical protein
VGVSFLALAIVAHTLLLAGVAHADTAEAKKIFTTRCMACHTFGKGVKVGPDLKGVTERRQRDWIVKMVRSSSTMVGSDPIAVQLFEQFKQQRTPRSTPSWTSWPPTARTSKIRMLGPPSWQPLPRSTPDASCSTARARSHSAGSPARAATPSAMKPDRVAACSRAI